MSNVLSSNNDGSPADGPESYYAGFSIQIVKYRTSPHVFRWKELLSKLPPVQVKLAGILNLGASEVQQIISMGLTLEEMEVWFGHKEEGLEL